MEQASDMLVAGIPEASSPLTLAIEDGTLWLHSSLIYRCAMFQVSSVIIVVASPRAAISTSANSTSFPTEMALAYSGAATNHFPFNTSLPAVDTTSKGLLGLIN